MAGTRVAIFVALALELCGQGVGGPLQSRTEAADEPLVRKVAIDFEPSGLRVSPSSKFAVVWGRRFNSGPGRMNCVIIELANGRVAGRHELPTVLKDVAVDDTSFYYAPETGMAVHGSPHGSAATATRILLDDWPQQLSIHPDGSLVVSFTGSEGPKVFDRTTGKPKKDHPLWGLNFFVGGPWKSPVSPIPEGLFQEEGAVFDARTMEVRCAGEIPQVIWVNRSNLVAPLLHIGHTGQVGWGRGIDSGKLFDARKTEVARIPTGGQILRSLPLVPAVQTEDGKGRPSPRLELMSAKTGELVQTIPLEDARGLSSGGWTTEAEGRLLLATQVGLFILTLPADLKGKVPVPLHLTYPKVPIVTFDGLTTFDAIASGGEGERRFALASEHEGLAIDARSGRVTIDGRKLWEKYLESLPKPKSPMTKLQKPVPDYGSRAFRHFTRKELPRDHLAATVLVPITVSDDKGGYDLQFVWPLIQVPRPAPDKSASAPVASGAPSPGSPALPKSGKANSDEQLRALEQGVGRVESNLKRLDDQLRDLEKSLPTGLKTKP